MDINKFRQIIARERSILVLSAFLSVFFTWQVILDGQTNIYLVCISFLSRFLIILAILYLIEIPRRFVRQRVPGPWLSPVSTLLRGNNRSLARLVFSITIIVLFGLGWFCMRIIFAPIPKGGDAPNLNLIFILPLCIVIYGIIWAKSAFKKK